MTQSLSTTNNENNVYSSRPVVLSMIEDFLTRALVVSNLDVASRKRLFESLATLIVEKSDIELVFEDVLQTLNERERLGSTGIGKGIALPHGRIDALDTPIIAVARLCDGIAYDAPDNTPVWLAVCLLVPKDANEIHLQLLSKLASSFQDDQFVQRIKKAPNTSLLYDLFIEI